VRAIEEDKIAGEKSRAVMERAAAIGEV